MAKKEQKAGKQNAIMLSKNFIGSFGDDESKLNIPHEIINEFRDDNGDQYIYIPPYGGYDTKKYDIKYVLFTGKTSFKSKKNSSDEEEFQSFEIKYLVEVDHLIAGVDSNKSNKTKQDEMKKNPEIASIHYGGKPLTLIPMTSGKEYEGVAYYATFKAKAIYELKKGVTMQAGYGFKPTENDIVMEKDTIVFEGGETTSYKFQRQRGYITEKLNGSDNPNYSRFISKILDSEGNINRDFWKEKSISKFEFTGKEKLEFITNRKESMNFMRLIMREEDETAYSNLIYNFFNENKRLLNAFVSEVLKMPSDDYRIYKEVSASVKEEDFPKDSSKELAKSGRVDLLIVGNKNIAVIENKIKSGLNGLDKENKLSQLSLYYWVFNDKIGSCKGLDKYNETRDNKQCRCFILKPKYAEVDWNRDSAMKDKYTVINYTELYEFLSGKKELCDTNEYKRYFDDFRNSLYYHTLTYDEDIRSRFIIAIDSAKEAE